MQRLLSAECSLVRSALSAGTRIIAPIYAPDRSLSLCFVEHRFTQCSKAVEAMHVHAPRLAAAWGKCELHERYNCHEADAVKPI